MSSVASYYRRARAKRWPRLHGLTYSTSTSTRTNGMDGSCIDTRARSTSSTGLHIASQQPGPTYPVAPPACGGRAHSTYRQRRTQHHVGRHGSRVPMVMVAAHRVVLSPDLLEYSQTGNHLHPCPARYHSRTTICRCSWVVIPPAALLQLGLCSPDARLATTVSNRSPS
jgi:hypothetical protein